MPVSDDLPSPVGPRNVGQSLPRVESPKAELASADTFRVYASLGSAAEAAIATDRWTIHSDVLSRIE